MNDVNRRQLVQPTVLAGTDDAPSSGSAAESSAAAPGVTVAEENISAFVPESAAPKGDQTIALVTGATRGIGLETARQLAAKGVFVLMGARDLIVGESRAAALRSTGFNVHAIELDLDNLATVERAASMIEVRYGRLDILVNNAGISMIGEGDGLPGVVSLDAIRRTFNTNFVGTVLVTQKMLQLLRKSPRGRIVNVSSTVGSLGVASDENSKSAHHAFLAYAASKASLNMLTILLAHELGGTAIKVNSVCPGYVMTDMNHGNGDLTVEQGAEPSVRYALLDDDGPTGGFFAADGPRLW